MLEQKFIGGMRTPEQAPSLPAHQNIGGGLFPGHVSANSSVCSQATTALVNNQANLLNASSSTHSSNNFYQNTMQSDASSLHKRKSVISSQSTGSSNDVSMKKLSKKTLLMQMSLANCSKLP